MELEKRLSQLAQANNAIVTKLTDFTHEVLGDTLLLAEQHHLFAATPEANHNLAETFEYLLCVRRNYLQMRFLDTKGMEVVRTNFVNGTIEHVAEVQLQNKAHRS